MTSDAADGPLVVEERDDRVLARLNRPDKRNAIDQATIDALHELCELLERRPRTLILTGSAGVFAAGADIAQLRERRAEDARRGINANAFIRIAELPMPVIAAIDGYALGGGAELAYAADIRIGTPALRIGNPEPRLAIMAAAGATWRLPELVGQARASELLLTGRILRAEEALDWGLVSSIHPAEELLDAANAIADGMAELDPVALRATKRALRAPRAEHPAIDGELQAELFERPEKSARMTAFLNRPPRPLSAPLSPRPLSERSESKRPHPEHPDATTRFGSVALRAASLNERDSTPRPLSERSESKRPGAPKHPGRIGVLGGGRMGAGIAHAFLLAGPEVAVVERDDEAADAAASRIRRMLSASIERGTTARSFEALEAALTTTTDLDAFAECELVVEAVPEDPALKVAALARVDAVLPDGAVLASNTSSLSIDELAAALRRPDAFLGMHFFNPVPASRLVELVVGAATAAETVERARAWVAELGKTPIVVRDSPGFASSRLGVALGLEAIRMLEEGVATAADIDAAMELGYRHPMGPLRTTDIVGLDVRLAIAEELHARLGPRFEPPELLRRMVAEGRLGRKSGEGFYQWNDDR